MLWLLQLMSHQTVINQALLTLLLLLLLKLPLLAAGPDIATVAYIVFASVGGSYCC